MYITNTGKLGIGELRDFISQLLLVNYGYIPELRRRLKKSVISKNNGLKSRFYKNGDVLYLGSYTREARNLMIRLKSAASSDSEFISELNHVYDILN